MKFLTALQFLTVIPVPGRRELTPEAAGSPAGYFPAVGILLGLILAGLNWLLRLALPSPVVSVLLIVALAVLTGLMHLDGFVDTCDGIAGHRTVEERWRIMHDSRAGGFGVIGVALLLLVKYVTLSSIPDSLMLATLVLMPIASRWAMVYAIFAYPYARPSGLGKVFKEKTSWTSLAIATLTVLAVAGLLMPLIHLYGLAIILGVWIMTVLVAAYLKSRLSGLTGDTYGAINELAEVAVLILVTLLASLRLI